MKNFYAICITSFFLITNLYSTQENVSNVFLREEYSIEPLIEQNTIEEKIKEVAEDLNREYQGKELIIIPILKGSICLAADLIRHLHFPAALEFVTCSSYGMRGIQRGELTGMGFEKLNLEGKHVLLIDDIHDSGKTLSFAASKLREKSPESLKSLVLLSKMVTKITDYKPDYVLFDIPDDFVVGYGLDYKEFFRGLPGIYILDLK